jgi:hypothetical protein
VITHLREYLIALRSISLANPRIGNLLLSKADDNKLVGSFDIEECGASSAESALGPGPVPGHCLPVIDEVSECDEYARCSPGPGYTIPIIPTVHYSDFIPDARRHESALEGLNLSNPPITKRSPAATFDRALREDAAPSGTMMRGKGGGVGLDSHLDCVRVDG